MSPHKPLPAKDLICKKYSIPKLWTGAAGKRKLSALLAVHPVGLLGTTRSRAFGEARPLIVQIFKNQGSRPAGLLLEERRNKMQPILQSLTVGTNNDGRLEVFGIGGGVAYHKWQLGENAFNNFTWSDWDSLGGTELKYCTVGNDADGRLEFFVLGGDGSIYKRGQVAPNGGWADWEGLGGAQLDQPAVGNMQDGSLEVFVVGGDKQVYNKGQAGPNGLWSDWSSLGANLPLQGLTLGNNQDRRLELFALDGNGIAYHKWQSGQNGDWSDWQSLQGHDIRRLTASNNQDGRLELFGIGGDQVIYHVWQGEINGNWGNWYPLGRGSFQKVAVAIDAEDKLQAFGFWANGAGVSRKGQMAANGGWEPAWTVQEQVGGNLLIRQFAVAKNLRKRLELFALLSDGHVYHQMQGLSLEWGSLSQTPL